MLKEKGGGGIKEDSFEAISKSEIKKKKVESNSEIKVVGTEIESLQKQYGKFVCCLGEKGQLFGGGQEPCLLPDNTFKK